jgi:hypothetical protein
MTVLMASFRVNAIPTSTVCHFSLHLESRCLGSHQRQEQRHVLRESTPQAPYSNITAALSVIGFDQVSVFPTHFSIVVAFELFRRELSLGTLLGSAEQISYRSFHPTMCLKAH